MLTETPSPDEMLEAPVPPEWFEEVRLRSLEISHPQGNPLERRNPEKAARALWMLAQGLSKNRIHKMLGVDRATLTGLEWRHSDTLESKRKLFSRRYAQVAEEFTDILFIKAQQLALDPEQLKAISPDKLAVTVGIMTDKAAMLSGMAGVVIEHRKGASIDDAAVAIAAARQRIADKKSRAIEAEVITETVAAVVEYDY